MKKNFAEIISHIGEDPNRPGLTDTPERAAKAFQFLTRGYKQTIDEVVNGALFPSDSSEMIIVQDIELYSLCEHHMLPFIGKADRKSTRLNSSHVAISYAVFCLKKKK